MTEKSGPARNSSAAGENIAGGRPASTRSRSRKSNPKRILKRLPDEPEPLPLPPFGPDRLSALGWDPAYFDTKLTSGAIEAVNGIIQLAKRMARGFKTSSTSEPSPTIEPVSSNWMSQT